MRGNLGWDWGQGWVQNQGPVTGCLDLLSHKISDPWLEKWQSYVYFKCLTTNVEVEAKAETEIKINKGNSIVFFIVGTFWTMS